MNFNEKDAIGTRIWNQNLRTGFLMRGTFAGIRPSMVSSAEVNEGDPVAFFYLVTWGNHFQREATIPVKHLDDYVVLFSEDDEMTSGEILDNIVEIMSIDGELATDDECVTMMRELLKDQEQRMETKGDSKFLWLRKDPQNIQIADLIKAMASSEPCLFNNSATNLMPVIQKKLELLTEEKK